MNEHEAATFELLHSVMECGGCGMVVFRTRQWFSEMQDYAEDPHYQYTYHPPRIERPEPAWYADLPDEIQVVLGETQDAFYNDFRYLTAVGIRTVLDMAIVEKIGDAGTFERKVDLLLARSLITNQDAQLLKTALDVGNAAAHRGYQPPRQDLRVIIDITESILSALFIRDTRGAELRRAADEVGSKVPSRRNAQNIERGDA